MPQEKMMPFSELVEGITKSRGFLGETAELMSGEMRQQFDTLLGLIDEHFDNFKTEVPGCLNKFKERSMELKADHEKNVADFAKANEQWEKLQEQVANGELPVPLAPEAKPVAPQLGSFLRDELLNKFAPQPKADVPLSDVAWRDWDLEGGWINPNSNQQS